MTSVKEINAEPILSAAAGDAAPPTQAATLSVVIDDGVGERTERLPALANVTEAMSAYDRLWNAAMERGYTLRGGTLEIDGRVYRVSQNGRLWDGARSVTETEAQCGPSPNPAPIAASPKPPIRRRPPHERDR
jgi:hypothetical protein